MRTITCEMCGTTCPQKGSRQKFCPECSKKRRRKPQFIPYITKCSFWGKDFLKELHNQKYCSPECREATANKRKAEHMPTPKSKKETLCWTCQNACGNCSWSSNLVPVDGWKARNTKVKSHPTYYNSFFVEECPEYSKDKVRKRRSH